MWSLLTRDKKRNLPLVDIAVPANKRKRNDKRVLGSCQRVEKAEENVGDGDPNWLVCVEHSSKNWKRDPRTRPGK